MKIYFGHDRLSFPREMLTCVALTLMGSLVFSGCSKREPASPPPPAADTNQAATPSPPPPSRPAPSPPPTIAASPDGGADLRQLNHAYIGWIVQNHRRPKSFEEYVSLSGVQVPSAPAGKKYIIDKNGYIALAGQ